MREARRRVLVRNRCLNCKTRSMPQKPILLQGLLHTAMPSTPVKIGYARVSTQDQNLDLQLRALKKAGCGKVFHEKVSGSAGVRPQFQRMLDQLREGDILVVWKLDRLARSTRDLLETMETIRDAGARFQSLSEPWADTTTHAGKMIMTVFAGIAEFERDLIRERTSAGRNAAMRWRPIRPTAKVERGSAATHRTSAGRREWRSRSGSHL